MMICISSLRLRFARFFTRILSVLGWWTDQSRTVRSDMLQFERFRVGRNGGLAVLKRIDGFFQSKGVAIVSA